MARRRYSDEERAATLAALHANAGNVRRTARQVGVAEATVRHWAQGTRHPEGAKMGAQKRGAMAAALECVAWKLVDALDRPPEALAAAPLNQIATALGIALDKMRLLRGQPTAIGTTRHHFDDMTDAEVDQRIAELESRLPRRPDREGGGLP